MYNKNTAYVIGLSIGDGNLSDSNGRCPRLRITCDNKYPLLRERIVDSLNKLFPNNKISEYVRKEKCIDVYCYSKSLEGILGWKAKGGSKYKQNVRIPEWIFTRKIYIKSCLKGLFETDGSIYKDRKYTYVNFTTIINDLKNDVILMIGILGYKCNQAKVMQRSGKLKYVVRVCRRSEDFIKEINIVKK
ncbi:MAG: LAGLIDADG family homing endonuclease [Candidatus Taylorbacteria bacterium]|nr:LAGLIDADG family homing endonuclease [Candidatus Taylorbacteria bacterium]